MIDQDPFDDAMRRALRLSEQDQVDVWSQVAPKRWVWCLPLVAAAATIAIAWQVSAPVPPNAWPVDAHVVPTDLMAVR